MLLIKSGGLFIRLFRFDCSNTSYKNIRYRVTTAKQDNYMITKLLINLLNVTPQK